MRQYVVTANVQIMGDDKVYRKNSIISEAKVGEANIKRYLSRGYIEAVGDADESSEYDEEVIGPEDGEFYEPDHVNKMKKPELLKYAMRIGMSDIDPSKAAPELRSLVNGFIAELKSSLTDDDKGTGGADA